MTTDTDHADVATSGGGIAGSSPGTVARQDLDVLRARVRTHRDRDEDETRMPWGWAEADRLGLTVAVQPVGAFMQ